MDYPIMQEPTQEQLEALSAKAEQMQPAETGNLPEETALSTWHPPVRNQLGEGACTGEATITLIGWHILRHKLLPEFLMGSPQANYAWSRMQQGDLALDGGSSIPVALQQIVEHGMAPEWTDIYGTATEFLAPSIEAEHLASYLKATSVVELPVGIGKNNANLIAHAISAVGTPVSIGILINAQLYSPINGIARYAGIARSPGAHNIVAMDYRPDPERPGKRLFNCQSSWGTDYGNQGFVELDEDYINQMCFQAGYVEMNTTPTDYPVAIIPWWDGQIRSVEVSDTGTVQVGQNIQVYVVLSKPLDLQHYSAVFGAWDGAKWNDVMLSTTNEKDFSGEFTMDTAGEYAYQARVYYGHKHVPLRTGTSTAFLTVAQAQGPAWEGESPSPAPDPKTTKQVVYSVTTGEFHFRSSAERVVQFCEQKGWHAQIKEIEV